MENLIESISIKIQILFWESIFNFKIWWGINILGATARDFERQYTGVGFVLTSTQLTPKGYIRTYAKGNQLIEINFED